MVRDRMRFAQNFIIDPHLVPELLSRSNITKDDMVLEIGAGDGSITKELINTAKQVIALEIDQYFYKKLTSIFQNNQNVTIKNIDFLNYQLPQTPYKVFSNIPFNMTADIVRKLIADNNPPTESYLLVQKEAAEKFTGKPVSTEFSVLWHPWFEFKILTDIDRNKFEPVPSVDVVFMSVVKRSQQLLPLAQKNNYIQFVQKGFRAWKKSLKLAFQDDFTYNQWKRLSRDLKFQVNAKPSELNIKQWMGLYNFRSRKVEV